MLRRTLPAAVVVLSALTSPAAAEIGWRRLTLAVPHQPAPLEGVLLYPAGGGGSAMTWGENPVFEGVEVQADAEIAAINLPVILLSLGLGSQVRALSWLAGGLAARGAVVVAVDHPGSTTGDVDMRRSLDHWQRTADLGAAIGALVGDAEIGPHVDPDRLFAAGFSYGGFTALALEPCSRSMRSRDLAWIGAGKTQLGIDRLRLLRHYSEVDQRSQQH